MKTIVIALGGNAILKKGEKANVKTQLKNTRKALESLFPLINGNRTVITHGNGPAVGYLLLQNEMARSKVPVAPLDVLDAETEGQIGYLIQQNLQNLFRKNRIKKSVVTVLTQVLVDKNDKAFNKPSKFIGPFYSKRDAFKLRKQFRIKEDSGRGWRRIVPSPKPVRIVESEAIRKLLKQNAVVIAAGGGGIPVIQESKSLEGVEAVVDKDLASACLANSVKADVLIIVTDVDMVYLNYRKKGQKGIKKIKMQMLKAYYEISQFPAGSMGPKIEAAMNFIQNGGRKIIITNIENIQEAIKGKAGTTIAR